MQPCRKNCAVWRSTQGISKADPHMIRSSTRARGSAETIASTSSPRAPRRHHSLFKYATIAPLVVLTLAFIAYPVYELVRTSLGSVRLTGSELIWEFVGLDNFLKVLDDAIFPVTVVNTLVFIFFAVSLTVIIGVALAFVTDSLVRGQAFFQNILIWPAVIAPVVISVLWLLILSPQLGLVNKIARLFGSNGQTWLGDPAGAMSSVIFVDVWHWTPLVYLLVYTALRTIDGEIIEAAKVDGAGRGTIIRTIQLPILTPTIVGVIAVRIIMGVKVFDEMYLLTHGGPGLSTTIISLYIRTVFFDRLDFGYGSALSILVILAVLVAMLLILATRNVIVRLRNVR